MSEKELEETKMYKDQYLEVEISYKEKSEELFQLGLEQEKLNQEAFQIDEEVEVLLEDIEKLQNEMLHISRKYTSAEKEVKKQNRLI